MHVGDSQGMKLGTRKDLSERGWMNVVILVLNYLGTSYKSQTSRGGNVATTHL
jgi:hypothetical protein